jgi:regulator of RNase E activity RraA
MTGRSPLLIATFATTCALAPRLSILAIEATEDGGSRSIGSSNIRSWQQRGMGGLVTSGGLADSDEIIHHRVPACFRRLARGIRPGRNELESVERPVTIGGVVVVPRERAEEVANAALPFLDQCRARAVHQGDRQQSGAEPVAALKGRA